MKTLYLRNVPDDVVDRLQKLATRNRTSVAALAVRQLAEMSLQAEAPALLDALPDLGIDTSSIVADVEAGRSGR